MKNLLIFLLIAFPFTGNTQNTINLEELYLNNLDKISINIIDTTYIYVNDEGSTDLFYYALSPKDSIQGTLVLFPPTWQTAENVINHTIELIKLAYSQNLLIIIPSINYNLCLDDVSLSFLNETFRSVVDKYTPPLDKIVFGGFSLGGMNAIRYTEMAYESDSITTVKPIAVYGVDPPLDFARLYHSFERTINKNFSQPAMNEAQDYIQKLNYQFGGPPEDFDKVYVHYSMYSKGEKDGGNAKYLASIPVRIYCELDIDWQLRERRVDYYDMNAVDQTAMINHLITKIRFRVPKSSRPHSN